MNLIWQIQYSMKRVLFDFRPLLTKLISSVIVILILGAVFDGSFKTENFDNKKVLYLNDDKGTYGSGSIMLESLMSNKNITELISFEKIKSVDEGKKLVNEKKASAFFYFPEKSSDNIGKSEEVYEFEVFCRSYSGANSNTDGIVIKNILNSCVNALNAVSVSYKLNNLAKTEIVSPLDSIKKVSVANTEQATSMQYYAIAMTIMLIMSGTVYGGINIMDDYIGPLGKRLKISPIKPLEQYLGKVIGLGVMVTLEAVLIILFTKFIYGVDWGSHYLLLLAVVVSTAFFAVTLGAMLTILTKSDFGAEILCPTIVYSGTFLSGGFIARDFGIFKYLAPNYYTKIAINGIIYNGDLNEVYRSIGLIWGAIAVIVTASIVIAKGRRE